MLNKCWNVECGGCDHAEYVGEPGASKADVVAYLRTRNWRSRKNVRVIGALELWWCPACVEAGVYARRFVSWAG